MTIPGIVINKYFFLIRNITVFLKDLILSNILSWLFGVAVFPNGVLNLFFGNDQGLRLAFLLLSFVYFPPVKTTLKKMLGFSIHYLVKIVFGMIILWLSLAVGALTEGYLF